MIKSIVDIPIIGAWYTDIATVNIKIKSVVR